MANSGGALVFGCCWKLAAALPLVLGLAVYLGPLLSDKWDTNQGYLAPTYDDIPEDMMDEFRMYDNNGDGLLDPTEFFELMIKLPASVADPGERAVYEFADKHIKPGVHALLVQAQLTPLNLSTMIMFANDRELNLHQDKRLPGLLQWKEPANPFAEYGVANFQVFLPSQLGWPVGKVYSIIEDYGDRMGVYMHSYHPPKPLTNEEFLHTLMRQFHSNPFVYTRFGPRGTKAIIRARNSDMVDIFIRSHVEFQLNELPHYPFWFTPAQLAGRLVINTTSYHILHFELGLPADKQLNVDMEWLIGSGGANEVDIGFCPQLRLSSVSPSEPWELDTNGTITFKEVDLSVLEWEEEISPTDAQSRLEKSFYPFKEVSYLPYLDAVSLAKANAKLVHLIMLWGALDDQSC